MNFDQVLAAAFRRAPASARAPITFTNPKTGQTATSEATGVPAKGGANDGFRAGIEVEEKHRRLSVLKAGLVFTPRVGHYAAWEGTTWNVIGVTPVRPGAEVFLYRVTLSK